MLYLSKLYLEWLLNYSRTALIVDVGFTLLYCVYIFCIIKKLTRGLKD